jgi:hypothetical protein
MKKKIILITAAVLLLPLWVSGQNLDDALRYSRVFYQGTARFNAMGGAFTALGGDLSAIALNPAAAAIFRSTEIAVSPNLMFRNLNTDYNGYNTDSRFSDFTLGQIGLTSSINIGRGNGLTGLSVAYSYNRTNNFYRHSVIDGISDAGSMADFWALQAEGTNTWDLQSAPYMAYEAWLIDTIPDQFTEYASIFSYYGEAEPVYGQMVKRIIDNDGYSGEHTVAFAANIGDKLYLGAGFGITNISYTGHYVHREIDDAGNIFDLVDFTYTDHFRALGSGWNFKMGAIVRPFESLRIGLAFSTPTIYTIDETFYSNLSANLDNDTPGNTEDDAHPVIEQDAMSYRYRLTTPYRINAGVAFQVGTLALLSADYEFVDYAFARLSRGTDGYDFNIENQDLVSELKNAGNLRLGAEVHLGSLYLRGGYSHYGSSFRDGTLNEGNSYNGFSTGIGYRQKKFYVDLSMAWLNNNEAYMMYPDDPRTNPLYRSDPVYLQNRDKYLTATVGLKF